MSTVSCPTCFRREQWNDGDTTVLLPGGQRRPVVHPVVAAWDSITRAEKDDLHVVGTCVCGQPLVADLSTPSRGYSLHLPSGDVSIQETGFFQNNQPITAEQIEAAIAPLRRAERPDIAHTAFQLFAFTAMLAPVLLWVLTATTVGLMILGLASPVGFQK